MSISSDQFFKILEERGIHLPKHCTFLQITLPSPSELVEIEAVMHELDTDGKFIVANQDLSKIEKSYRLYEVGRPMKCSCCERYFKP